jgi:hypothetical protein
LSLAFFFLRPSLLAITTAAKEASSLPVITSSAHFVVECVALEGVVAFAMHDRLQ